MSRFADTPDDTGMNTTAHDRDHDRLNKAWDAWNALGRPAGNIKNDVGNRKRAARRTFGLRLQAHMAVHHGVTLRPGWSFIDTFTDHANGVFPDRKDRT